MSKFITYNAHSALLWMQKHRNKILKDNFGNQVHHVYDGNMIEIHRYGYNDKGVFEEIDWYHANYDDFIRKYNDVELTEI